MPVFTDAETEAALRSAVGALERGGVVVTPTDTVYGVAADPQVPGAEARLFHIKRRPDNKPVPLLIAGPEQLAAWGANLDGKGRRLADRFWPGALTLVLPVGGGRFEGFRVPDHPVILALLRSVGGALRVTSANVSGEPPALTAQAAVRDLGEGVDVVLDAGPVSGGVPSTVVKLEAGQYVVIREGAISAAALAAAWEA